MNFRGTHAASNFEVPHFEETLGFSLPEFMDLSHLGVVAILVETPPKVGLLVRSEKVI